MAQAAKKVETLTLTPSQCATAIKSVLGTKRAVFMWGPPGISKSQSAQQIATEVGMAFIDMRLSQMDPSDLRGIPYPAKVGGVEGVRWSAPYVLPRDLDLSFVVDVEDPEEITIPFSNPVGSNGLHYCTAPRIRVRSVDDTAVARIVSTTRDSVTVALFEADHDGNATDVPAAGRVRVMVDGKVRGILALEEFNSAAPSVQAAAYQLVLDRRLGEYIVPDGVDIIGMGNRDTDKGVTFKMPTPIMNRFIHIEMRSDFDDWQRWALMNMVHKDVVGYLSAFKSELFQFEAGTAARGFATPRSWEFVSDILKKNEDLPENVLLGLVVGAVGDGTGVKFCTHRKDAKNLPKIADILDGRVTKMPSTREISLSYMLTTAICYELKDQIDKIKRENKNWKSSQDYKDWNVRFDFFLRFAMENFTPEICIMAAKTAVQYYMLPIDINLCKTLDDFTSLYREYIMGR